jgi:hypothetical protein
LTRFCDLARTSNVNSEVERFFAQTFDYGGERGALIGAGRFRRGVGGALAIGTGAARRDCASVRDLVTVKEWG